MPSVPLVSDTFEILPSNIDFKYENIHKASTLIDNIHGYLTDDMHQYFSKKE